MAKTLGFIIPITAVSLFAAPYVVEAARLLIAVAEAIGGISLPLP